MKLFNPFKIYRPDKRRVILELYSHSTIQAIDLDLHEPDWSLAIKDKNFNSLLLKAHEKQAGINNLIVKRIETLEKKGVYLDLKFIAHDGNFTEVDFIYKEAQVRSLDIIVLQKLKSADLQDYIKEAVDLVLIKIQKM